MGKCCDYIISVFCPLLLPQERRATVSNTVRVYVLWFFLVAIFLTAGLTHGLGKFHPRKTVPAPDTMYYVDWISNDFCSAINVTTKWPLQVNAYLMNKHSTSKAMCNISTEIIAGPTVATIPPRDIYTMKVNLKKGDRISGGICMSHNEKVYIFTRQMNFLRCVQSDSWTDCGLRGPTRYWVESDCKDFHSFDDPFILYPQSISKTGDYYFVFYNSLSTHTKVSARFTKTIVNKYLLQTALKTCNDQSLCQFDLGDISESKVACFEAVRRTSFPDREDGKDVQVTCAPRLWLYFLLFFIIPIIIAIIGSVLICICCKKKASPNAEIATGISVSQRYTPSSYSQRNSPRLTDRNTPIARPSDNIISNRIYLTYLGREREDTDENENTEPYYEHDYVEEHRNNLHIANSDPPPSYDEVMKGVFV